MKKYSRKNFTLIELLAAMAVFSILLMVSLRLFNGAQQMWLRSEQKTDTFASGRTAMEFIASRMQALIYLDSGDDFYPFYINEKTVWFTSKMATGDRGAGRHFLQFRLVDPSSTKFSNAGTLQMVRYTGQNEDAKKNFFGELFPRHHDSEWYERKIKTYDQAMEHLEKVFEEAEKSNKDNPEVDGVETRLTAIDICENVIELKFSRYVVAASGDKLHDDPMPNEAWMAPYLVEVELKMLDSRESFLKWKNASDSEKKDIFLEHGYTFRRAILLGKKGDE